MKICIISNPNSIHIHRWLDYFACRGHEMSLISHTPAHFPLPTGVRFLDLAARFNVRKLRYVVWPLIVRQWVQQVRADILHVHFIDSAARLGTASGFHPFLLTAHGSDLLRLDARSRFYQRNSMRALRKADFLTCVSPGLVEKALSLGVPADRVELIMLGVDTDLFAPPTDRQALRSDLGLGKEPILFHLRGLKPVYNPLLIAQALPMVLQRFPTARLMIPKAYGEAQTLAQFETFIEQEDLAHSVQYVDPLWDDRAMADQIRVADVGISVASSDGTPKSVQEAMACEVPVVAGDIPALREWIQPGENGLLVPLGDPEALAAAIIRLLEDGDLRRILGKQARLTICERADSKPWMARSEEIYYELVRAHGNKEGTP